MSWTDRTASASCTCRSFAEMRGFCLLPVALLLSVQFAAILCSEEGAPHVDRQDVDMQDEPTYGKRKEGMYKWQRDKPVRDPSCSANLKAEVLILMPGPTINRASGRRQWRQRRGGWASLSSRSSRWRKTQQRWASADSEFICDR